MRQAVTTVKKNFDSLVDGEASSPATATLSRFLLNSKEFWPRNLQGSDFFCGK